MRSKLGIICKIIVSLVSIPLLDTSANATWSIIAVDRETGEVGIAGASCTDNVHGIGKCIPGKGVVVVQAMSNTDARKLGVKMLEAGASPKEIIEAMRDSKFDPENQQYGAITLQGKDSPEVYSGKNIAVWNGATMGDDFAVMGNILVNEEVVNAAVRAYNAARGQKLSDRLMLALAAGAKAGGDKRCGEQQATSAFVTVCKPKERLETPYLDLVVYRVERGAASAVSLLAKEYERWEKTDENNQSSQILIVPGKQTD